MINVLKFNESIPIDVPLGFAVFCDMDGTLVDTDYANYLSYRRAIIEATCGAYDIEFTVDRIKREGLRKIFPQLTFSQIDEISTLKERYFTEFIYKTKLNFALAKFIVEHCSKNAIILVTCCREKRAMQVLEFHKIIGCFERLIFWECLPKNEASNKYENAIKLTNADVESLLLFEDDSICIRDAIRVGVPKGNIYKIFIERSGVL